MYIIDEHKHGLSENQHSSKMICEQSKLMNRLHRNQHTNLLHLIRDFDRFVVILRQIDWTIGLVLANCQLHAVVMNKKKGFSKKTVSGKKKKTVSGKKWFKEKKRFQEIQKSHQ